MKSLLWVVAAMFISHSAFAVNESVKKVFPPKQMDKSKAPELPKVELVSPKALSIVQGPQVDLEWKAAEGATSYRVQVATDANFKWLVSQKDFLKETKYTVSGLETGKTYHWRVFAWKKEADPNWTSSFAAASSFEVK